jgi:hypothetical protein
VPFLRFNRDRRGYENTFLVQTLPRKGGGPRTRILYWFRSPPDVKVGRAALDEEAIRELESLHPELASAWGRILESRPASVEQEPGSRESRRDDRRPRPEARAQGRGLAETAQPGRRPRQEHARPAAPALRAPGERAEAPGSRPAAREALGTEDLSRFRARHAEMLARINQRVSDPAVADELRTLADGLNPDVWVTSDDVSRGMAAFNGIVDQLRERMGLPRRGRRGGRKHRSGPVAPDASAQPGNGPAVGDDSDPAGS